MISARFGIAGRFGLLLLLTGAILAGSLQRPAPRARAQELPPAGLDTIRAAYDITLDKYFRPLSPSTLLRGGWDLLTQAVARNRLPQLPARPLFSDDREAAFMAFASAYSSYVATLPASVRSQDFAFTATAALLASLNDGHTGFIGPQAPSEAQNAVGADLPVGVGITVASAGRAPFIISQIVPAGPAEQAGLQVGDVIVAADGRDVTGLTSREVGQTLAGTAGSSVRVTVDRAGSQVEIVVVRGPFYSPPLSAMLLNGGVGYLRLSQFAQVFAPQRNGLKLLDELDGDLDSFDAQGATGLILDLRGNLGGLAASEWAGRFLPEDALTLVDLDARGHRVTSLASGQMHRRQLPMVVLVNGSSASSSEVVASAFHESHRALVVGTKTLGGLRMGQIFTLPGGASMQVSVAEVETPYEHVVIEGKGYPVDVDVPDARTAADYRAGRDPQLAAALAALATAPAPPAFNSTFADLSAADLHGRFASIFPTVSQIPLTARLARVQGAGDLDLTHVNQAVGSAADPLALQAVYRRRGWQGAHLQSYAPTLLGTPRVTVVAEQYASDEGAADAISTLDEPQLSVVIPAPVQLGDQTVAFRGLWFAEGDVALSWRHGSVVFTVNYSDAPGSEDMAEVTAVAMLVEQVYLQQGASVVPPSPVPEMLQRAA